MKQCLVYCRDFLFLSMWSSVSGSVMDQKKKTLGILLGPMCYGVCSFILTVIFNK